MSNPCWHQRKGLKQVPSSRFRVPGFQGLVSRFGFWVSSGSTTVVAQAAQPAVSRVANVANPRTSEVSRRFQWISSPVNTRPKDPAKRIEIHNSSAPIRLPLPRLSSRSQSGQANWGRRIGVQPSMRAIQTQSSLIKPDPTQAGSIQVDQARSSRIKVDQATQPGGGGGVRFLDLRRHPRHPCRARPQKASKRSTPIHSSSSASTRRRRILSCARGEAVRLA